MVRTWRFDIDTACRVGLILACGSGAVGKAACLESRDREFESHSGLLVSKKQNVSSPLTRKD